MTGSGIAGKKVLVTGATGFIGSHMAARLVREKARVSVLVRETSDLWRLQGILDRVTLHCADIRDPAKLESCLKQIRPGYVFHLSAYGVDARQKDPRAAVDTNIAGLANLMGFLKETGCEKFLNIGSCMEYGDKNGIIREDALLEPFNIYGGTKAAATILAHQLAAGYGIPMVTLRAFGIFGEKEGSHKFFPHIILSLLEGLEVNLTFCEQYRDYCYIDDIVDGFLVAARAEDVRNDIFNIGRGAIHPLKYYVDLVYELMGRSGPPRYGAIPYRRDEVWKPHPDVGKIKARLQWEPRVSLRDGLLRTIAWYEENRDIYREKGR